MGIELLKKIGDPVQEGEALAILHMNVPEHPAVYQRLLDAIAIGATEPSVPPLVYKEITPYY